LERRGQYDEAFAAAQKARDLDPLNAGRHTALASLSFTRRGGYEVTVASSREAYRLEESLTLAKAFEGRALALLDRGSACLELELGVYVVVRALCLYRMERESDAMEIVREAERQLREDDFQDSDYMHVVIAQDLASYHAWTGNVDAAIRWTTWAFDLSPAGVDERILDSELFEPVMQDPDFAAALERSQSRAHQRVAEERAEFRREFQDR